MCKWVYTKRMLIVHSSAHECLRIKVSCLAFSLLKQETWIAKCLYPQLRWALNGAFEVVWRFHIWWSLVTPCSFALLLCLVEQEIEGHPTKCPCEDYHLESISSLEANYKRFDFLERKYVCNQLGVLLCCSFSTLSFPRSQLFFCHWLNCVHQHVALH